MTLTLQILLNNKGIFLKKIRKNKKFIFIILLNKFYVTAKFFAFFGRKEIFLWFINLKEREFFGGV